MDYVSAVGLASSVITFVEFAWNLIAGAVETYRSVDGTLAENARLDDVKDDLDYLADLLDKRLTGKTKAERRIARVAADCHADSKELQSLLGEIAGPKGNRAVWRSLKASWMNLIKRKDVAELKTRLQEHRSVVLLQVTLLLSEEQSSLNRGIAKIRDDCSVLKIGFRTQITSTRNKILDAIDTLNECTSRGQETNDSTLSLISKLLLNIHTVINDTHIHHRILRQLVFEEMDSRASQIPKAAQETYHWTVEDGPSNAEDQRRGVWKLFLEWLRTGQRILHVSGNPGSGKSTLMKFLSQHERTQQELQVWAAPKTLVFGVFHFWNPGSRMQRSLTGLYRSLLFQALSQCPELTEEVFPVQFRRMKASKGDKTVEKIHHFDEDSIENGLKLLLNKAITGPYRICFFIDGLDECEGNRLHHEGLAEMFQDWITCGSIKICVSSRPYLEFIRPLNHPGNRLIQLHELNKSDITAYCLGRLGNDVYARERGDVCRRLVRIVVEHAQGVFLWVHLVVDILLVGFRQDDPDSVLEAQLNALPSDLDMLYTKLRVPIEADKIQRARANRMLLLAARNPSHLSLTSMAFSWLEGQESDNGGLMGPNFPACGKMKPYSEEEIAKRLDHVTKQIDGLARGFLEIQRDDEVLRPWGCTRSFFAYRVQFCHRTARDYLLDNEHRHRSLLDSFPDFEQSQPYAKICIAEAIYGWHSKSPAGHDVFAMFDQLFRQNIDPNLIARWEVSLRESLTPTDVTLDPTSPAVDTDPDSSVRQ
ncbi:hypothetical protein F5883DRAFT_412858 [Diaporthe sp. PMI_573]|nr:hypothetical protein F5883DRAFT_412858 [Diaporthaceae sp. PMI_573]